MEQKRFRLSARLALIAVLVSLTSCTTLKILVMPSALTAREHVDLGLSYEEQGDHDLAEKEYRKAVAKEPDWAVPYFNLGNLAYRDQDLAAAERFYEMALTLDRSNPDVMNNLATVYHEQGKDEQARALIEKALSIRHRDEYLDTLRMIEQGLGKEGTGP